MRVGRVVSLITVVDGMQGKQYVSSSTSPKSLQSRGSAFKLFKRAGTLIKPRTAGGGQEEEKVVHTPKPSAFKPVGKRLKTGEASSSRVLHMLPMPVQNKRQVKAATKQVMMAPLKLENIWK